MSTIHDLRSQLERLCPPAFVGRMAHEGEAGRGALAERAPFSTGIAGLDRLLPAGGVPRGSTIEWLSAGAGSGASLLALAVARQAMQDGGVLVVIDHQRNFYPPAAACAGIDLQNSILVRPDNQRDAAWAFDQALRCRHVAAVIGWPAIGRAASERNQRGASRRDDRTFRRWQLAAEQTGSLGLFIRPSTARHEPSWADLRLLVSTRAATQPATASPRWRFQVELLKCRGRWEGGVAEVEMTNDK